MELKMNFIGLKPFIIKRGNRILWKQRQVEYNDFQEIREYIDTCLEPNTESIFKSENLTNDANLLLLLIDELEKTIPCSQIPDMLEFIPLPLPDNILPCPEEKIKRKSSYNKRLRIFLEWREKYGRKYQKWVGKNEKLKRLHH